MSHRAVIKTNVDLIQCLQDTHDALGLIGKHLSSMGNRDGRVTQEEWKSTIDNLKNSIEVFERNSTRPM